MKDRLIFSLLPEIKMLPYIYMDEVKYNILIIIVFNNCFQQTMIDTAHVLFY